MGGKRNGRKDDMMYRIHPHLRWAVPLGLQQLIVTGVLIGLLVYGHWYLRGTEYALYPLYGAAFFLLIGMLNVGQYLNWLTRASRVYTQGRVTRMRVTIAKGGWAEISPLGHGASALAEQTQVALIGSGWATPAVAREYPEADVYFERQLDSPLLIHIEGLPLLCSQHGQTIVTTLPDGAQEAAQVSPEMMQADIEDAFAYLRRGPQFMRILVLVVLTGTVCYISWYAGLTGEALFYMGWGALLSSLGVPVGIAVFMGYGYRHYTQGLAQLDYARWMLTNTMPDQMRVSFKKESSGDSAIWYATLYPDGAGSASPLASNIRLLYPPSDAQAQAHQTEPVLAYQARNNFGLVVIAAGPDIFLGQPVLRRRKK
jgi:hypothetical protein